MKSLRNGLWNRRFSHIYVEEKIAEHALVKEWLSRLPGAEVIKIGHYKDVFSRAKQSYLRQHRSQSLILAAKEGRLVYDGAPVCQDFGNKHFYYTSCVMNCIYDCEYCYLKGMYPTANIVVFVNYENIFSEIDRLLEEHEVYLCISYDSDLLALEHLTGLVKRFEEFASKREKLTIEVRTKCASAALWEHLEPAFQMIYAFSLSPEEVIREFEHGTPSLKERTACIRALIDRGFRVRLCFDPMIYVKDYPAVYQRMLNTVYEMLPLEKVFDVSVGSFRISKDYLKHMRRGNPDSAITQFPYENENGVCHYPKRLMADMEQFLTDDLQKHIEPEKIFLWKD